MHLSFISLYPVKALRGFTVEEASVEPWGLSGDRRWMAIDARGRFLSQREIPFMARIAAHPVERGLRLSVAGHPDLVVQEPDDRVPRIEVMIWKDQVTASPVESADAWLTLVLGQPARLVYMTDPAGTRGVDPDFAEPGDRVSFADGFPLLATTCASLADLNSRLEHPLPMNRFRPNLVIEGPPAWEEDRWRRLRVGAATFAVVKPCARCAVTITDQDTGERASDREPLRTLQTFRRDAKGQVLFGQNLIPLECGLVRVGDPVEVLG